MPDAGMSRALLRRYWGWATLFRSAATGLKPTFGIDLAVLAAQFGGGASLAFTWVLAGLLTGVFSRETRYDRPRVVLTWLLAAPSAQLLKEALYGGFRWDDALTDVLMTLVLMLGLRLFEEEGILPPPQ
mmetsp:Transcript_24822/g.54207  ORF Transcript_24822/g.54207 Transcript_24822/m.54207 type:complete len:129 (-) Transcript_24822:666-1052(-)